MQAAPQRRKYEAGPARPVQNKKRVGRRATTALHPFLLFSRSLNERHHVGFAVEVGQSHRASASSKSLSSMRFAIALLVILAIASIIGTVLTQDDPYPNYVNQFGPFWADIFRSLSLYTVYSAWWFMLILASWWCRCRCA